MERLALLVKERNFTVGQMLRKLTYSLCDGDQQAVVSSVPKDILHDRATNLLVGVLLSLFFCPNH